MYKNLYMLFMLYNIPSKNQQQYPKVTMTIPQNQAEYVAHLVATSSTGTYPVLSAYRVQAFQLVSINFITVAYISNKVYIPGLLHLLFHQHHLHRLSELIN